MTATAERNYIYSVTAGSPGCLPEYLSFAPSADAALRDMEAWAEHNTTRSDRRVGRIREGHVMWPGLGVYIERSRVGVDVVKPTERGGVWVAKFDECVGRGDTRLGALRDLVENLNDR